MTVAPRVAHVRERERERERERRRRREKEREGDSPQSSVLSPQSSVISVLVHLIHQSYINLSC